MSSLLILDASNFDISYGKTDKHTNISKNPIRWTTVGVDIRKATKSLYIFLIQKSFSAFFDKNAVFLVTSFHLFHPPASLLLLPSADLLMTCKRLTQFLASFLLGLFATLASQPCTLLSLFRLLVLYARNKCTNASLTTFFHTSLDYPVAGLFPKNDGAKFLYPNVSFDANHGTH